MESVWQPRSQVLFATVCCFLWLALLSCSHKAIRDPASLADARRHELRSERSPITVEIVEANLHAELPFYPNERRLYYRLLHQDTPLVLYSPLGLETDRGSFARALVVENIAKSKLRHDYSLAHGKTTRIQKDAELFTLTLRNPENALLYLEVVLQHDAAAFRYRIPGTGHVRILQEHTGFRLEEGVPAIMQQYQEASKVSPAYEYYFEATKAGTSDDGKASIRRIFQPVVGFTGLVIFGSDGWALPALFEPAPQKYILIAEAGTDEHHAGFHLSNPENGVYRLALPAAKEGNGVGAAEPEGELPYTTAYRVVVCCDLKTIYESTAITDLSAPLDKRFGGKIPAWIRPGKATWDWLSYVATGDPERQKKYIDAAAEFGWEYTLIDANWNKWNNGNAEALVRELANHAKSKNVGIWLWYNSGGPNNTVTEEPRDRMHERSVRRAEFARLREWGVRGVKIDFWQSDKQNMMRQYIETLEDAADFGLMVNFHGCTMPRGWQRRFPHLMTMEAVKGAEWYQFPVFRGPNAADNVYYALVRNVVGHVDFTPVFEQPLKQQKISYAHAFALPVILESGIQHLAGKADDAQSGYRKLFNEYPFMKDFLRILPAFWDETRLLHAHPQSHVVVARRNGKRWFVAAISSAEKELVLDLPLGFLPKDMPFLAIVEGEKPDQLRQYKTQAGELSRLVLKPRGGAVFYSE